MIRKGNRIGKNFFIGPYAFIRGENVIGDNVSVGSYTEICGDVVIEDNVNIHSMVFIPNLTVLKKGCWIGPRVTFANDPYPQTGGKYWKGAVVGERAIIGAAVTVMPGVKIGDDALIGAGSRVAEDVPAGEVWAGNPAKFIKKKEDIDAYSAM